MLIVKKEIQQTLIDFLQSSDENYFHSLTDILDANDVFRNTNDSKISNNSHRLQHFSEKIEQILLYLKSYIKQACSNSEIFAIFYKSKLILY